MKIAHISDLHYLEEPCGRIARTSRSRRIRPQDVQGFRRDHRQGLRKSMAYQPDLVLVSGDLTKDGELICHTEVHDKIVAARKELAAAGKQTPFRSSTATTISSS
ncbi:MAG: metallophosphoesterase [Collinsella sp.]